MKTIKVKEMGAFKIYCVKKPLLVQECWISFVMGGLRLSFFVGGGYSIRGETFTCWIKKFFLLQTLGMTVVGR